MHCVRQVDRDSLCGFAGGVSRFVAHGGDDQGLSGDGEPRRLELDEARIKEHIRKGGYFEPTPQYDDYILDRFRIGGPYPHLDEYGRPVVSR
jgi:hypothetical protein